MPKINVVDFNSPPDNPEVENTEPTHEAEQLTEIHNTIKDIPEQPQPKPKTKRPKKVKPEPEPIEQESEEPPIPEVEGISPKEEIQPVEEIKPLEEVKPEKNKNKVRVTELHKCEGCGKEMTKKSLRYSHAKNCPAQKPPPPPPETKAKPKLKPQEEKVVVEKYVSIPQLDSVLFQSLTQQARQQRMQRKQENIKKLALQIA
jgi:hypothetical protein